MSLFGKFWDRLAPLPQKPRADGPAVAQIDDYVGGKIRPDGPGLALAVVKDGTVVHAAGYGLANVSRREAVVQDTIFHLASCGKQFTGLGILILAEQRKLGFDDPVGKHLPGLANYGPKVTIRRLLNQTSGIRDLYDESGMEAVLSRCARPSNADVINVYNQLGCPMVRRGAEPGTEFAYSNSGYDMLGAVIERVSGQTYHDFFQALVFDPLGMKDTFSAPDRRSRDRRCATGYVRNENSRLVEASGSEFDDLVGSGSFYTTIPDLCLYDRALATNALVSEASMREALTSGRTNDGQEIGYGFGWYVGVLDGERVADHQGEWAGCYTYIGRYLDRPLSIFALSNNPQLELPALADAAIAAVR